MVSGFYKNPQMIPTCSKVANNILVWRTYSEEGSPVRWVHGSLEEVLASKSSLFRITSQTLCIITVLDGLRMLPSPLILPQSSINKPRVWITNLPFLNKRSSSIWNNGLVPTFQNPPQVTPPDYSDCNISKTSDYYKQMKTSCESEYQKLEKISWVHN